MTNRILAKMYSPSELSMIYLGHHPDAKCIFKGCDNYVAGNTEERFCPEHWSAHVEMMIFGYGPFAPKSRKTWYKRATESVALVYTKWVKRNK